MKMAFTGAEKAFCVLQFAKCDSIVMIECRFRAQHHNSFINKTGTPLHFHFFFIMMSMGISMTFRTWVGCRIV